MAKLPTGMRKRPGGGYEYRFTYKDIRCSVGGGSVEECREKKKAKEKLLDAGIYHTNETITLDQYFEEWLNQKAAGLKSATIFNYRQYFNNHISPYLGKCRVCRIERRQVVNMMGHIMASKGVYVNHKTGKRKEIQGRKGRKIATANFARRLLGAILNGAVADDIILRNVVSTVPQLKRDTPPARENIHRELTDEELRLFFSSCKHSTYYPVFKFLLYTGVRSGECAGLKWLDIDWLRGIVHICRTMTKDKEGHWIVGDTPKTRTSKRDIPMNTVVREVLTRQWEIYRATHEEIRLDDPVFPDEHGGYSNGKNYGSVLSSVLHKLEKQGNPIQRFGLHAFRDTFASRAIRSGVEPNTLKEIMGHASLAMTMDLYAHVNQDDKKEAMEKLKIANF